MNFNLITNITLMGALCLSYSFTSYAGVAGSAVKIGAKAAPKIAVKAGKIAVTAAGKAAAKKIASGSAKATIKKVGAKTAKDWSKKLAASTVKAGKNKITAKSHDELTWLNTMVTLLLVDELVDDIVDIKNEKEDTVPATTAGDPSETSKEESLDSASKLKLGLALNKMFDDLSVQALRYVEEDSADDLQILLNFYRSAVSQSLQ